MKLQLAAIGIFICMFMNLQAQHVKISTLRKELLSAGRDTNAVMIMNKLSDKFRDDGAVDSALLYAQNAKQLAQQIGFKRGLAIAYSSIGTIYKDQGDYVEALKHHFTSLKINEEIGNNKGIAADHTGISLIYSRQGRFPEAIKESFSALKIHQNIGNREGAANAHNNIGLIYKKQGNYQEALKEYAEALKYYEEVKDYDGISKAHCNIGIIYEKKGNYPQALKEHFASLKIEEATKNKKGIARSRGNIGNIYLDQGNYTEALKEYTEALNTFKQLKDKSGMASCYASIGNIYLAHNNYQAALKEYIEALKIDEETGDAQGMADSYTSIGGIYLEEGNYAGALKDHTTALAIYEEIGDQQGIAYSYNNLGNTYMKLHKPAEAKKYLDKGLAMAKEIESAEDIKLAYGVLSEAENLLGNHEAALSHYKNFIIYRDSLVNEENTKKTAQTQMQYEFDKKESITKAEHDKKDAIAAEEKRKHEIIILSITLGLALVVAFALVIFRSLRVTKKQKTIIELQKHEVEQQKAVTEIQKQQIEEKHREITDSINYAERIQRSFLASDELLNENLKDYFILFKPKGVVSGDFYWASKIVSSGGAGNFALATADSTGHGVPGAIMSLLNITSLERAAEHYSEPSDILNATRKTIIERLKKDGSDEGGKDGMDCSVCVYDFKNKTVKIAASNNPVWIVRASAGTATHEVIEFKSDKMPVGKHDKQDLSFTQQEVQLQTGDVVYTLTDGFPDQFGGEKGKKFMSKNLRELLVANSHLPMLQQKQLLETTFKNWIGNLEQVDDVTVIGIRV